MPNVINNTESNNNIEPILTDNTLFIFFIIFNSDGWSNIHNKVDIVPKSVICDGLKFLAIVKNNVLIGV